MFSTHLAQRQPRSAVKPVALAVATALVALSSAHAQTAAKAADSKADAAAPATVVVTGYRYAIEQSLDQKRAANAIVEVITAEDVGKFPDKNVADALQRVPGVIVNRDGGEGKNRQRARPVVGTDADPVERQLHRHG